MKKTETLAPHEWLAVATIVFFLGFLVVYSHFKSAEKDLGDAYYLVNQEIDVRIEGAVKNPGNYTLKRGDTLQELLEIAVPLENANLNRVNAQRKLRNGQKITIPAYKLMKGKRPK